jgi:glycosyltransferase involved in cell wall biosynthesis
MRVALVTTIISPYRIPVFNALAAYDDIDLTVFFLSETEMGRDWKIYSDEIRFRYHVFGEQRKSSHKLDLRVSLKLLSALRRGGYEVVVWGGYDHLSVWGGLCLARLSNQMSILWSESTCRDKNRWMLIEFVKSLIVRSFDRYLAAGRAPREYLLELGAASAEVYVAPDAVDSDFFSRHSSASRQHASALKMQHNLPSRVVLFVGRLVPKKGLPVLFEAFRQLKSNDVGLVVVGDGPKRTEYERICQTGGIGPVVFAGFQQREQLPFYYGIADIFVLPSLSEPWGLVLNEALSCGLPVIASSIAGAAYDLVLDGINGYRFEPGNATQLACLLDQLLQDEATRQRMGRKSREIIQFHTPARSALGFVQAIRGEPNTAGLWSLTSDSERRQLLVGPGVAGDVGQ